MQILRVPFPFIVNVKKTRLNIEQGDALWSCTGVVIVCIVVNLFNYNSIKADPWFCCFILPSPFLPVSALYINSVEMKILSRCKLLLLLPLSGVLVSDPHNNWCPVGHRHGTFL